MSKDSLQAKQKLRNVYDPALAALTAKPEMVFESGRVKIKAPIPANANLGPYSIEVQSVTPVQMSGALKPPTISGTLEMGKRKYKYSAAIEFKVDVIWHQRPKGEPKQVTEPVGVTNTQTEKKDFVESTNHASKWDQTVNEKGVVVAVVLVVVTAAASILYRIATRGGIQPAPNAPIMPSFTHTINRHQPQA